MFVDSLIALPIYPEWFLRFVIRILVRKKHRLETKNQSVQGNSYTNIVNMLSEGQLATDFDSSNDQHYEVSTNFFKKVLGDNLKYSCALWTEKTTSLSDAEEAMLALYCDRAQIKNGQEILELGCGWGSLSLYMAKKFPKSKITAMSSSNQQRLHIESQKKAFNLTNLNVITKDINEFDSGQVYDRIVSIEMFEHLSNYKLLFEKLQNWLKNDGAIFIHVFGHKKFAYQFVNKDVTDWMSRNFFTGGVMPSERLFSYFENQLFIVNQWRVPGIHYMKTANEWVVNMRKNKNKILEILSQDYPENSPILKYNAWKIFFLACAELFGFNKGNDWMVFHYLMKKKIY